MPFALSLSKGERQLLESMENLSVHGSTSSPRTDLIRASLVSGTRRAAGLPEGWPMIDSGHVFYL
jgi:hypothetical protein